MDVFNRPTARPSTHNTRVYSIDMAALASFTPLHEAAHRGDAASIQTMLSTTPPVDLAIKTSKGDTALHLVSLGTHVDALTLLLSAQPPPDANATNADGWTPLMLTLLADSRSKHSCIQLLLRHGASIMPVASGGWNAVILAASKGDHIGLATLLELGGAGALPILPLTTSEVLPTVLSALTAAGDSALHLAAHAGSALCVRLLLAAGIDASLINAQGLDAATLCVSAACGVQNDPSIPVSDEMTSRYEEILTRLAASTDDKTKWCAMHGHLLRTIAGAPPSVPPPASPRARVVPSTLRHRRCRRIRGFSQTSGPPPSPRGAVGRRLRRCSARRRRRPHAFYASGVRSSGRLQW